MIIKAKFKDFNNEELEQNFNFDFEIKKEDVQFYTETILKEKGCIYISHEII
jgi:hypothetical protein